MGVAFYESDSTVKKKDFKKCISYIHVNIYMIIHIHIPYIIEKEGRNRPKAEIGQRPKAAQSFKGIRKSVPDFLEVAMCSRGKGKSKAQGL